ncbi:pyocin knob domain-containing protein [Leisingera sp. M527]|uniref:pyocin knob domain-containing protein n=1 Tax=Leisingera sp. M527 TaxID=2867014 RepID=UPI0021A7C603|nr:pyocin knob domain-containing protein [Leisingera sp. M527]UWQ31300.1 pyocin knob domain-containing protein [Leisingera sp. M527]
MAWPKAGTVSVVNGSAIVTGTGTSFFGSAQAGWGFVGPDGRVYEVLAVSSGTGLTITPVYQGATAAGQIYALFPTMSLAHDVVASVQALTGTFQAVADGPGQGKFSTDVVKLGDEDTGLGWPSSNEVALKAGGDWQLRLKEGAASGAAVQSSSADTAEGKLLRLFSGSGVFGLGVDGENLSQPPGNNLDTLTVSGEVRYASETVGAPSTAGIVMHRIRLAGDHMQLAISHDGAMFLRTGAAGGWSAWRRMDPDRGSGPNGEYVRFADGTLICTHTVTPSSTAADSTWNFPAVFATASGLVVYGAGRTNSDATFVSARPPTNLNVAFNHWNTSDARVGGAVSLTAIGRWE